MAASTAARYHDIGVAKAQQVGRGAYRVGARRAGREHGHVGAVDAELHRRVARGHVGDDPRDREGVAVAWALFRVRLELGAQVLVVPCRRAYDAADAGRIVVPQIDSRVLNRHEGGRGGHLGEAGHPLGPLLVEVFLGREAADLAGDAAAIAARVEGLDRRGARFSRDEIGPKGFRGGSRGSI